MLKRFKKNQAVDHTGELIKFIHIGSPKCASTSLQKYFFNKEENCHYLGGGIDGNVFQYIDDKVKRFSEIEMRYSNSHAFDVKLYQEHFSKLFEQVEKSSAKMSCGISYEAFSFTYGPEIDVETKASRLAAVFGRDTKILFVIRDQMSLYKSLYGEHVREGYSRSYEEFLNYSWVFKHRNWFYDFDYNRVYDIYKRYFDDVVVLPFEMLKENATEFITNYRNVISGSGTSLELPVDNAKMTDYEIEILRSYNQKTQHTLQNDHYKPFHIHRYSELLDQDFKDYLKYGRKDLLLQLSLVDLACSKHQDKNEDFKLEMPEINKEQFSQFYHSGNVELAEKTGLNLEGYGYW